MRICAERVRMHPKGGHHSFIATQSVAFALVEVYLSNVPQVHYEIRQDENMHRMFSFREDKACASCMPSAERVRMHPKIHSMLEEHTSCGKTLLLRERVPRAGHQKRIKGIGPKNYDFRAIIPRFAHYVKMDKAIEKIYRSLFSTRKGEYRGSAINDTGSSIRNTL